MDYVSFRTDGWSNASKSCSLQSFTSHFLHQSMREKVILAAMVLEEDHTGEYLASELIEAIQTWNLDGKVHMRLRDNAPNIACAMHIAKVESFGSMAHRPTLQLVLHDALFSQTTVENVVKKSRRMVSHFKHSEQACRHLVDCQCQQSCDVPANKLIQDVETCWNSTFLMLQRLSEQRKALSLYSVEHSGIVMLTKSKLEVVERICAILKPFYDATLEISRDDTCISVVIPIVSLLLGKLQESSEDVICCR